MTTRLNLHRGVAGTLLLAAVAACRNGDIANVEDRALPWLAVLAEEALDTRQRWDGVLERPVVNVATATGLEHHRGELLLVHGAVDRDARPRYVLREGELSKEWVRRHLAAGWTLPEVPLEEPPPIPYRGQGEAHFEAKMLYGPMTLALDAVEVNTEHRKVAVFSVFASTVPHVQYHGKVWRTALYHPAMQYRVEGVWDGLRWIAGIKDDWPLLPEYSSPTPPWGRLPELHIPDFVYPKEPVR